MTNLPHSASFHANEKIKPSNYGIKRRSFTIFLGIGLTLSMGGFWSVSLDQNSLWMEFCALRNGFFPKFYTLKRMVRGLFESSDSTAPPSIDCVCKLTWGFQRAYRLGPLRSHRHSA